MHTLADVQLDLHTHTFTEVSHNMYSLTPGSEYTAIHPDGTYCKARRHLNTPSIACDRCCQEESTFIPFLSLFFWHAYLCAQCGHVTEAVSFSLPVPL